MSYPAKSGAYEIRTQVYSVRPTANAKSTWEQLHTQLRSPLAASGRRIEYYPKPAGRTGRNIEGNAPRTARRT